MRAGAGDDLDDHEDDREHGGRNELLRNLDAVVVLVIVRHLLLQFMPREDAASVEPPRDKLQSYRVDFVTLAAFCTTASAIAARFSFKRAASAMSPVAIICAARMPA